MNQTTDFEKNTDNLVTMNKRMNAVEAIQTRKSVCWFLPKEVAKSEIEDVIRDAMRAPSYKNTQPWEVVAVLGNKKVSLSEMLLDLLDKDVQATPDITEPLRWPVANSLRFKETMTKRNTAYGIVSGDPDALRKSKMANFKFYSAPVVLYFYHDASLGMWSVLDMGMFIQNVMLGFHARGISTVPQAFLTDYAAQVKQHLSIPNSKRLVLGMSVGYEDTDKPRRKFTTDRVEVSEIFQYNE